MHPTQASAGSPDWATIMTGIGTVALAAAAVAVAFWSDWRLRRERDRAVSAEQYAEASLVEVVLGKTSRRTHTQLYDKSVENLRSLIVVVVNRGRFTITAVEVAFGASRSEPLNGYVIQRDLKQIPSELRSDLAETVNVRGALSPLDVGMRFESYPIDDRHLDADAIVSWMDRWGSRWTHTNGDLRLLDEGSAQ